MAVKMRYYFLWYKTPQKILLINLSFIFDQAVREESSAQFHVIQKHIILNNIDGT